MIVCLGEEAEALVLEIDGWWRANRPHAPNLFLDELRIAFERLQTSHNHGVRFKSTMRPNVRRILLPKTRYHVYFEIDEARAEVHVLSVWGAIRRRPPPLT